MKREKFFHKGKIKDLDKSADLKYWRSQPAEARLSAVEEIRREYHQWKYGTEPEFQRVFRIVKQ